MLHVLKDYAGVSCFLVLFAGIMSGLTLGLMSLGLVELEILQRSGTPNKKKQARKCHLLGIKLGRSSLLLLYRPWLIKRAKAELKGRTLKTVSDKGNGSNSAKSLTGSEKAKLLKKTELVKKPLPKMTKTPGKSVVEVKERKGPGSRGSQEIKDHGHVKFILPGFPGSSPKTNQSFPQKQNSKSNQFAGSPEEGLRLELVVCSLNITLVLLFHSVTCNLVSLSLLIHSVVTYNNEKRNIHRHTHAQVFFLRTPNRVLPLELRKQNYFNKIS